MGFSRKKNNFGRKDIYLYLLTNGKPAIGVFETYSSKDYIMAVCLNEENTQSSEILENALELSSLQRDYSAEYTTKDSLPKIEIKTSQKNLDEDSNDDYEREINMQYQDNLIQQKIDEYNLEIYAITIKVSYDCENEHTLQYQVPGISRGGAWSYFANNIHNFKIKDLVDPNQIKLVGIASGKKMTPQFYKDLNLDNTSSIKMFYDSLKKYHDKSVSISHSR